MILLLAVHDKTYPRNQLLRRKLSEAGAAPVRLVEIEWARGRLSRLARLVSRGFSESRDCTVVFVSEFGLQYAIVGWAIAKYRGVPLVVDHFVGVYETHVLDYGRTSAQTARALYFRFIDWLAFRLADYATIDTATRADLLELRYRPQTRKTFVLPVGAPSWSKRMWSTPAENARLEVLYYGNYIPLHGVQYVIDSLALLDDGTDLHVTLIGSSNDRRPGIELAVAKLGVEDRVTFIDSVPEPELAAHIERSHVVLGIFGRSEKAASVLANKLWQGLYAGRTVINRDSRAVDELSGIVGDQLVAVDETDPLSLSRTLTRLAARPWTAIFDPPTDRLDDFVDCHFRRLFTPLSLWQDDNDLRRGTEYPLS